MRHQKKLDKVTAPAARFQGWKAMPLGSKIAVVVLVALALMAILAPELAPFKPGQSGLLFGMPFGIADRLDDALRLFDALVGDHLTERPAGITVL